MKVDTILVAADLSDNSLPAVRFAGGLAQALAAALVVVHVIHEPPASPFELGGTGGVAIEEQLRQGVTRQLNGLVRQQVEQGVRARAVLRTGHPFVEIINTAREENADLVVVGTHGYSGLQHMMLGSVAERVLRKAPCPVMVVPSLPS